MLLRWDKWRSATGFLCLLSRKLNFVQADEIRLADVRQYTLENSETLIQIGEALQSLISFEESDYPIGWGEYEEERQIEIQGFENDDAQRQQREPFVVVPPITFLELNKATDDLLYELMQRILEGYYDEENEARRVTAPPVDPYEDPFANRENALPREEVGFDQPSPPLYFYTPEAKTNALISLRRFRELNEELVHFEVEVENNFYWHEARLQGALDEVWEYFWDLLLDIIVYFREVGIQRLRRWRLPAEIVDWIYLIRDVELDDDEPDRPNWREYSRQGLIETFTNFQEMHVRLYEVHEQWVKAAREAFRPPILRDHPDIVPLYDLVKQQNEYVRFYLSKLKQLRSGLHRLPQLFPTRQVDEEEYDDM
ncbi:hypothetical protein TWF696_002482 [Orbilia brochopaga]|uniref:Uncharacterized protein n=1 Tax=Orbilia brochopaga TaxID=3140254 RepID=A0AAV9U3N0_9PEZI